VKRAAVLIALAACGDNAHPTDPRLTGECIATFAGNFDEQSIDAANCPTLTGTGDAPVSLGFAIASATLGGTLGIALDLGVAPAPGRYTSTNAGPWSALGLGSTGCVYSAGDTAIPPGSYVLDFDGAHGTLAITEHVLAIQGADCGPGDIESITIDY
jgi:hypothetical protein